MAFQSMLDIQISSVYRLTLSSAVICIILNLGNTEDSMEFYNVFLPLYRDKIRNWYFVHLSSSSLQSHLVDLTSRDAAFCLSS